MLRQSILFIILFFLQQIAAETCVESAWLTIYCEQGYQCCNANNNNNYWCCRSVTHKCSSEYMECKLAVWIIILIIVVIVISIASCVVVIIRRRRLQKLREQQRQKYQEQVPQPQPQFIPGQQFQQQPYGVQQMTLGPPIYFQQGQMYGQPLQDQPLQNQPFQGEAYIGQQYAVMPPPQPVQPQNAQ